MSARLTSEEDAELRRLAALSAFGELDGAAARLYEDLRARDRRSTVREPVDLVMPQPRTVPDGPVA